MTRSRYFGEIDDHSDYVDAKLAFGGGEVRLDLNVAAPAGAETWTRIDGMLDELARHDAAARASFAAAMADEGEEPLKFWRFHHDEVEGYEGLLQEAFTAALQLRRVGFYPDHVSRERAYLVMDYALPGPPTDQLLVAKLAADGSLVEIAWES